MLFEPAVRVQGRDAEFLSNCLHFWAVQHPIWTCCLWKHNTGKTLSVCKIWSVHAEHVLAGSPRGRPSLTYTDEICSSQLQTLVLHLFLERVNSLSSAFKTCLVPNLLSEVGSKGQHRKPTKTSLLTQVLKPVKLGPLKATSCGFRSLTFRICSKLFCCHKRLNRS